jgi:predicted nucleic-acid-binding Zn-ribbon protein
MKTSNCPKCGSTEWERGKIYEEGGLTEIRFKADSASALSLKKKLIALACSKCGYVEFSIEPERSAAGSSRRL